MPKVGPPAGGGRLRFLGPLVDLVAVGLYKPALTAVLSGDGAPPGPPIDRGYLLKILDEEIARPFGHPLRPVVELVLNAADAAPRGGLAVDVTVSPGRVEVADGGEGMDLGAILSRLLLPFATDKREGVHIGRFGVGFFSVLGFGAAHPDSFALDVETGDGASGYVVRVAARGRDAATFVAGVYEIQARRGTRVTVASALLDAASVRAYVEDALHFFPPERAVVRLGGVAVNDGRLVSGGAYYEDEASPGMVGRFHLGGRALAPGITAAVYHAGVKVRSCYAIGDLALVDFPGAVELTEGRDALKPGPAFRAVAAAFHRRLARIGADPLASDETRLRIAELAGQVSALMLDSAGFRDAVADLVRSLLGDRHLVAADRAEALAAFLGPGAADRLFSPESFWAAREWQGLVLGERELLEDELAVDPAEPLAALARRRTDLPGLALLAARAPSPGTTLVALAQSRRRAPGPLPCLGARGAVLVRGDAPAVRAPRGWADRYALRTSFDRALGMREADIERDLIVASPIGAAREDRCSASGEAR